MTFNDQKDAQLGAGDRQLVDLVTAALVDPNIHTDMRMRLCEEITEILGEAHHEVQPHAAPEEHRRPAAAHEQRAVPDADGVTDLLADVLVDPNLHTDTRMRLHSQISRLLGDADIPPEVRSTEVARRISDV